jgi:hypothetical protein
MNGTKSRPAPFKVGVPPWADSMAHWIADLVEEYPDLRWKVSDLQDAIRREAGSAPSPVGPLSPTPSEALDSLLEYMSTEMNTHFPKLTKAERDLASDKIAECIKSGDFDSDDQAIACGLRLGAPGKYKSFEKRRRA